MRGTKLCVGLALTGTVLAGCGRGTPGIRPTTGPTKQPAGTLAGGVDGTVSGVAGAHVVARWQPEAGQGDLWAVHGTATGTVEASVDCPLSGARGSEAGKANHTVALSGNGHYLVAGPVAFDLTRKKGICLSGDDDTKPILLASVADDGTAYGTAGAVLLPDHRQDDRPAPWARRRHTPCCRTRRCSSPTTPPTASASRSSPTRETGSRRSTRRRLRDGCLGCRD